MKKSNIFWLTIFIVGFLYLIGIPGITAILEFIMIFLLILFGMFFIALLSIPLFFWLEEGAKGMIDVWENEPKKSIFRMVLIFNPLYWVFMGIIRFNKWIDKKN